MSAPESDLEELHASIGLAEAVLHGLQRAAAATDGAASATSTPGAR